MVLQALWFHLSRIPGWSMLGALHAANALLLAACATRLACLLAPSGRRSAG
jgi:hypothetical protein